MDFDRQKSRMPVWIRFLLFGLIIGSIGWSANALLTRFSDGLPRLDRRPVVIESVQRGDMVHEIRGIGQLVSEKVNWVSAESAGRIMGVFLTTTYSVSTRRQELRTRVACGATPVNIIHLILRHSMFWTMIGLICGAICVAWLIFQRHTFGVTANQLALPLILIPIPITFAAALASLLVAVQFASAPNSQR